MGAIIGAIVGAIMGLLGISNPTANSTTVMGYLKTNYDLINKSVFLGRTEVTDFLQSSTVTNQWYTIIDSSETGFLTRFAALISDSMLLEIKITIDGVSKTYTRTFLSAIASDIAKDVALVSINFCDYYANSLKVEVRRTSGTLGITAHVERKVI